MYFHCRSVTLTTSGSAKWNRKITTKCTNASKNVKRGIRQRLSLSWSLTTDYTTKSVKAKFSKSSSRTKSKNCCSRCILRLHNALKCWLAANVTQKMLTDRQLTYTRVNVMSCCGMDILTSRLISRPIAFYHILAHFVKERTKVNLYGLYGTLWVSLVCFYLSNVGLFLPM